MSVNDVSVMPSDDVDDVKEPVVAYTELGTKEKSSEADDGHTQPEAEADLSAAETQSVESDICYKF